MNAISNRQSQHFSLRRATRRVSLCMPTPTDPLELSPRIHVVVICTRLGNSNLIPASASTPHAAEPPGLAKPRLIQYP